jgi:hypothetical protein
MCNLDVPDISFVKVSSSAGGGIDINVKDIMDTWTLQMGYPVVTIRRRGRDVTAAQARFLFNPRANHTEEFASPYGFETSCYLFYYEIFIIHHRTSWNTFC